MESCLFDNLLKERYKVATIAKVDQRSMDGDSKTAGAPGTVVVAEDPAAPSRYVSSKRQSLSDLFTIVRKFHWHTHGQKSSLVAENRTH